MIIEIDRDVQTGNIHMVYLLESSGSKLSERIKRVKSTTILDQAAEILGIPIDHFEYRICRTRSDLLEIGGDIYKVSDITYEKRTASELEMMMSNGYWD